MQHTSLAVLGAPDLARGPFLSALERVIGEAGYALEWSPGVATGEFGAPEVVLKWISYDGHGTWVVLPKEPHGRRIATALVRVLGRPLLCHRAHWFHRSPRGELSITSDELLPDGAARPRPTGLERVDLDEITGGPGEEQLELALHQMMGTSTARPAVEQEVPLYELAAGPRRATDAPPPESPVQVERISEILTLLQMPGSRGTLRREGADQYAAIIRGARPYPCTFYLKHATAQALLASVAEQNLPPLNTRSLRGAFPPSVLPPAESDGGNRK